MSKDYFEEFPPELILLLSPSLSTASLNALASTCRRFHEILQPELDGRITPELGRDLLLWAAESKPHIVAKLLSPPHSIPPSPTSLWSMTALHVAAKARSMDTAKLLLDAGADPAAEYDQDEYQPLHMAAENKDLEMMKLLLDHGAPIDTQFGRDFEVVKLLLSKGADATVTVPLFILLDGGPPYPHAANLLYISMGLRHPTLEDRYRRFRKQPSTPPRWEGLPLSDGKKKPMALLLVHGASKDTTMATITTHLAALSKEAQYTEEEYLEVITGMLKEAEDAIPDPKIYGESH
ncbi:ANK-REP-REGION domain-containing protein [Mycena venus]|uniref:ANK-REP-REGION domain-containing protein n=1 Tax=Mycena venus TaxID=2733690 RepID=A0A8H6YCC3_9AGAR|nr:ANK-REP-REGION domain-containing protein [Mycena venus]